LPHTSRLICETQPEEKMAALYVMVIKKNIYEEYDEEYGVKPIFILESEGF
jgi:hypothetical protein